jgi:hypothetical protein
MKQEGTIIEQLMSNKKEDVIKALELIKASDNVLFVQPLVTVYILNEDPEVHDEARVMLNTLKVKGFEGELMECLRKGQWKQHFGAIMAFLWNAGGNPTDYVFELVQLAVQNGPETMLECFSILEAMEGPIPEDQLIEAQHFLHNAHKKEVNEYDKNLIALLSNALADKEVDLD